jgi:aspartate aminotransferase
MPRIAAHVGLVPPSGIRRVFEVALATDDVVNLAVGEPHLPVAPHVVEAARAAWAAGLVDYGPNGGIAPLRAAVAAKLARDNAMAVDPAQVWVTVGATQALHQALGLVLDPGDEVLVPDPGYTVFSMAPRTLGAVPVPYPLRPEDGFRPDPDALRRLITPRTRALVVNSPSNPLGVVLPEADLRALLDVAREADLWVLSDEVYEHFADEPHASLGAFDADGRVLSVFSLSKSYAMTGARVGYLVAPLAFTDVLPHLQEATISCVAMPDQHAALAALTGPQDSVAEAARTYRAHRALAGRTLDEAGVRHHRPQGAFYLWVDVSHASGGDVDAWCLDLLRTERVAVAPGSAFGRSGEGWVRVNLAVEAEHIVRGLKALPSPA